MYLCFEGDIKIARILFILASLFGKPCESCSFCAAGILLVFLGKQSNIKEIKHDYVLYSRNMQYEYE